MEMTQKDSSEHCNFPKLSFEIHEKKAFEKKYFSKGIEAAVAAKHPKTVRKASYTERDHDIIMPLSKYTMCGSEANQ